MEGEEDMIEVNIDTYVNVAEADEYVGKYYLSTDDKNTSWAALTEAQKETALRNSAMAIDSVVYPGRKKDSDQEMEFPRCYKNGYYFPLSWYETYTKEGGTWHCMAEVPEKIKHAQVEEALEMICRTKESDDFEAFNGTLKSFSLGDFTENYSLNYGESVSSVKNALRSKRAQRWMSRYAGGSFNVN